MPCFRRGGQKLNQFGHRGSQAFCSELLGGRPDGAGCRCPGGGRRIVSRVKAVVGLGEDGAGGGNFILIQQHEIVAVVRRQLMGSAGQRMALVLP